MGTTIARHRRTLRSVVAVLVAALATACASAPRTADDAAAPPGERYVLAMLLGGPRGSEYDAARLKELIDGHFATIQRLAASGDLVVAGPFMAPRTDPRFRGIYVFRQDEPAEVEALVASDPSIANGVFAVELHGLSTPYDLEAAARRAAIAREARVRAGDDRMEAGMRQYVIAMSDDAAAFDHALAGDARLVFTARLDGGPRGFHLLDVADLDAARTLLEPHVDALGAHALHPWFGSEDLVRTADAP